MHLIYGSTAIKHWFPDFPREPNDLDIIATTDMSEVSTREAQYYFVPAFLLLAYLNKDKEYVDPDFLYTIKVSHVAWDINWEKTIKDIQFLKGKGCKLNKELFLSLHLEWEKIHGKKKVKMNVQNTEFFKENIYRKYNHEELHEHFAFYDRPLNERIRKDLESPLCSKDLWQVLNEEDKLKCALEEIFVLASERYILVEKPKPLKMARIKTLKQMITSTTSGWFNLYLILHFEELRTSEDNYFKEKLMQLQPSSL